MVPSTSGSLARTVVSWARESDPVISDSDTNARQRRSKGATAQGWTYVESIDVARDVPLDEEEPGVHGVCILVSIDFWSRFASSTEMTGGMIS
jgi:hypothetical protein